MNVVSVIFLVLAIGLVCWLLIDTIIYVVKRVKQRKIEKIKKDDDNAINNR